MNEWRGLHNPDYHEDVPEYCLGCNDNCSSGGPCPCCLKAEVERLTAELADRDRLLTIVAGKHMAAQERIDAALRLLERCEEDTRDFYGGQEVSATVLTAYVRQELLPAPGGVK